MINTLFLMIRNLFFATSILFATHVFSAPKDSLEVTKAVAGFAEAWNRHDMQAFGQLFTSNADFVNVAGKLDMGRAAIVKHHAYSHGTISQNSEPQASHRLWGIFSHSTMAFDSIGVRFLRHDVAVARVAWRLTGDVRSTEPRTGMFLFVVVENNGKWAIAAAQNTEINRKVH